MNALTFQDINPKDITVHTVVSFKPRTSLDSPLVFDSTNYSMYHPQLGWKSINADVADKEAKKMGKIPYGQKKLFWWALAK